MGGRMWVNSEEGKGSTFFASMFLESDVNVKPDPLPAHTKFFEGMIVLTMVPCLPLQRMVSAKMAQWGITQHSISNSSQVTEILKTTQLDAILVDEQEAEKLAQYLPTTFERKRMLVLTFHLPPKEELHQCQFVRKPIHEKVLIEALSQLLNTKKIESSLPIQLPSLRNELYILVVEDNLVNQKVHWPDERGLKLCCR
jgi:CheY-like chemotaxis protein